MKVLALTLLLVTLNSSAVTYNSDGSVTMTKEEYENNTAAFAQMMGDSAQYEADRHNAAQVLKDLLKQLEALRNGKCI